MPPYADCTTATFPRGTIALCRCEDDYWPSCRAIHQPYMWPEPWGIHDGVGPVIKAASTDSSMSRPFHRRISKSRKAHATLSGIPSSPSAAACLTEEGALPRKPTALQLELIRMGSASTKPPPRSAAGTSFYDNVDHAEGKCGFGRTCRGPARYRYIKAVESGVPPPTCWHDGASGGRRPNDNDGRHCIYSAARLKWYAA